MKLYKPQDLSRVRLYEPGPEEASIVAELELAETFDMLARGARQLRNGDEPLAWNPDAALFQRPV